MRQLASPVHHVLTPEQADDFAEVLKAMAHPHRLRILSLLQHAPGGLQQQDIVEQLPVDQSTISMHMRRLRAVGLVNVQRDGRWVTYRPAPGALAYVASFLGGGR